MIVLRQLDTSALDSAIDALHTIKQSMSDGFERPADVWEHLRSARDHLSEFGDVFKAELDDLFAR